ncbi:AraC-like DNA-binding protein [Saccharothrix tamanrassetensis]|uniref:AraC-like DNA-binding protein n=1 Tax=Saccharothrix tamanrassetensis TaxID=1051531 RepID=A0A841CSD4_9PSEU|nr:helix-turn-helix domain-containing protein [Saccharothrix tamanrassetensis]MBB5959773.1 AraC-like DNA-binding protein [Saccharothrix tamanrassetensis]
MDAWEATTASALVTTEFRVPDPGNFVAALKSTSLGTAQVTALSYNSLLSRRTPTLIRRSDPEQYQLALIRTGHQGIDQARTRTLVEPGEVVAYDSSRAFDAWVDTGPEVVRSVVLQFPKRLLPLPDARVARLLANPLPPGDGVVRLLSQFLTALADEQVVCTARDAVRLEHTAVDLAAVALAHHLDAGEPPLRSPQRVLYLRITSFINEHLHRPDLTPPAIASAHRISLRYLHRIFQQQNDRTVHAYIRSRRVECCRRDLADPSLQHRGIGYIAARWGFVQPADFSRAFRRATGLSPREYRVRAITAAAEADRGNDSAAP